MAHDPSSMPPLEAEALTGAPDALVVSQALTGHEPSAREIVRRYGRPVFNLIDRMVQDRATVEDLTQEAFAKVFRGLHTFDTRQRFAAWILKVAHNTAIDHLRRRRPRLVPLDAPADDEELPLVERLPDRGTVSPERSAERRGLAAALDAALARVRPEYREVIVLRYQEDLEYAEIASVLELPLGTVKTLLHRGRLALRRELTALGWGPEGRT